MSSKFRAEGGDQDICSASGSFALQTCCAGRLSWEDNEATKADGSLPVVALASCEQDLLSSKSSSGAGQDNDDSQMRDTQL